MKKSSKRMRNIGDCIDSTMQYDIIDGLRLLKTTTRVKFVESVDVAINLGINTRKSDQNVRNNVVMPYGIGKNVRIAVFAQGDDVRLAKSAGADLVGLEDLYDHININGCNNFDIVLSSPDVMHIVSKLGPILGPRGLMPNPKMGTVSKNIVDSIKNIKLGQVQYKNDRNGIIHVVIGKINFDIIKLKENLESLITSIKQVKPVQCKGTYIKKIFVSTTMGKSVLINKDSLGVSIF